MPKSLSESFLCKEESYPQNTSIMREQIDCLSASEKEIQARLDNERLEYLVKTVEGEVQFEGLMEEMCMNFKADDEIMDLERREREWEMERREVRFEEEIATLKDTVCRLEEELNVSHAEKELALQKKQEEIERVIWTRLLQVQGQTDIDEAGQHAMEQRVQAELTALSNEELKTYPDGPSKTIVVAFEDALKAADERFENQRLENVEIKQSKEKLEQNFHEERQCWISQEKQLKSQANLLEKDIARLSTLSQEKDALIALERERQAEYLEDAENAVDTLREENRLHSITLGKLQKLENILLGFKEKLSRGQEVLRAHEDLGAVSSLEESLMDLDEDLSRISVILSQKKDIDTASPQLKLIEAWKAQRDTAIRERDTLEEKLSLLLRRARDREAEVEAMWAERETTLLEKVHSLQGSLYQWEARYKTRETELLHERKLWQDELGSSQKNQVDGKPAWEGMTRGETQWSKSQDKKLTSSMQPTESESLSMRAVQKNIVVPNRCFSEDTKSSRHKILCSDIKEETPIHDTSRMDGSQDSSTGSSETQESSSKVLLVMQETVNRENKGESCDNFKKLAKEMESEVGRLSREVIIKEEKLEKEQSKVKLGIELLREERRELEKKFFENLLLMEDLKREITVKECKMEQERKQLEVVIFEKAAELEQIKTKLISKEHEMDNMQQKFRTQIQMIEEEVEKERKERQQVMDLHFASKKKLINEMDLKEEKQEKEMDRLIQELQKHKTDIDIRDQEYHKLSEKNLAFKNERKLWEMVGRKQNPQLAFTISKLMKENEALHQKLKGKENTGSGSVESHAQHLETAREKRFHDSRETGLANSKWLWLDSCEDETNDHNEKALEKLAVFQKQLAEAMLAIDKLKEELRVKEIELLKARTEPESKWEESEAAWSQEQDCQRKFQKDQEDEWIQKEYQLIMEKEQLSKLLEVEQLEAADAIASLQGQVRELKWSLAQYQENAITDSGIDSNKQKTFQMIISNTEVVKVHTSHLEKLDQYILELKTKLEDSHKNLKAAEATSSAQDLKNAAREENLDAALMEIEKEVLSISGNRNDHFLLPAAKHGMFGPHCQRTDYYAKSDALGCSDNHRVTKLGGQRGTLRSILRNSFKPVNMIMQEGSPGPTEVFYDESILPWDPEVGKRSIFNTDVEGNSGKGPTGEEPWMIQESYCEGQLTFGFPPLRRHQQRWLVDAAWLEHVRKEHAFIKRALLVEQQRTYSLAQIKEENKFLDALVIRALEKKLDCEQRAAKLQEKVSSLQTMIAKASLRDIGL